MVAKVNSGKTIRGALNYNENKVKGGVAKCIMANQFGCEPAELGFQDKFNRFEKLIERNQKVKTNAIHISLNFHPAENLSEETYCKIASLYMERIGFGDQPYLVYQHHDAAHPHMHILTTNVQHNGRRIDIHNIGRNQSEKARIEIEKEFKLVRAGNSPEKEFIPNAIKVERSHYGKSETKRSIANVVLTVTRSYKYTSLAEFNAVLRQFNVVADRGKEGTRMHSKKGLVYSLLDEKGNKVGVPIKASAIYGKPMLPYLEKQFQANEALRKPYQESVKACIDRYFKNSKTLSRDEFGKALHKDNIYVLLRESGDGRIYGITFVDNKNKVVFNGSDLGKGYSATALLRKISNPDNGRNTFSLSDSDTGGKLIEMNLGVADLIQELVTSEQLNFQSPDAATKRKRKKKRRRIR